MSTGDRLEHFRSRYAALIPGWETATYRYQQWVAERLTPETRILDLGCGRGGIVERLHGSGHWIGVDPDWASLREHRWPALPRSQAPAQRLPFAAQTFDRVTTAWVLEHLPEPAQFFREVARILRPGGRFFYLTPNARHPLPRLSRLLAGAVHWQRRWVARVYQRGAGDTFPVFYRCNTPEQIARLAGQVGLQRIREEAIADPSYFCWNEPTFRLATRMESLIPARWKVHLIGEYLYQG